MALGPVLATPNANVANWIATQNFPPCPAPNANANTSPPGGAAIATAPPPPRLNPATLAIQFWQTIPLPAPRPSIPPGYAITGKLAYLVTNGTLAPPRYQRETPLGPLSIIARASYLVDWGDGSLPTWTGPYQQEGGPYPNGTIFHTYDYTGIVTVTVRETWTATWSLGPASGVLDTLQTTATIPAFRIQQLQAVITG
jgi:hypothetical protein